jgi:predicted ATPase
MASDWSSWPHRPTRRLSQKVGWPSACATWLYSNAAECTAIGKIYRRLDGLPQGIELAAARLRALGVEEVLECLNASLRMLVASCGSRPER